MSNRIADILSRIDQSQVDALTEKAAERKRVKNSRAYATHGNSRRNLCPSQPTRYMKRRAQMTNAIPKWFGELDSLVEIEAKDVARRREKATGIKWHIDHLIPLLAKDASGFHCAHNIQVIPAKLNMWKKNRLVLTNPLEWLTC